MKSLAIVMLFATSVSFGSETPTEDIDSGRAPAGRSSGSDEIDTHNTDDDDYDFSWLDPDKKVYVIQNRKYRKAWRPALFLTGAMNLSNEFRNGFGGTGRLGMWFSEQFGAEVFVGGYRYSNNNTLKALQAKSSAMPFLREIRSYMGAVGAWAPFYGKFNFFNHILYYDWSLNFGLGSVNTANDRNTVSGAPSQYVSESFLGFFFGTAQTFYVTRHFLVRAELIGVNYGAKGGDDQPRRYTNFDFALGVGYLF